MGIAILDCSPFWETEAGQVLERECHERLVKLREWYAAEVEKAYREWEAAQKAVKE